MRIMAGTMSAELVAGWWDEINESTRWQDGIFFALSGANALVSSVALIQFIRIKIRAPEFGWTTQKTFHLMNFIVSGARAVMFGLHRQVFILHPMALALVLLDLPGLLFFSTYTMLVLFWAEIYNQARSRPTNKLQIYYFSINGAVYFVQVCIWAYLWINDNSALEIIGKVFLSVVWFAAALGFLLCGGRLFVMLKCFPIESRGRRKKLREVGWVAAVCFTCFLVRCIVVAASAFDAGLSLDVLNHPVLNLMYYLVVEILPSALALYILRKLPPNRSAGQYRSIRHRQYTSTICSGCLVKPRDDEGYDF